MPTLSLIMQAISISHLENGCVTQQETGIVQGASVSPILSNLYLTPLDKYLESIHIVHFRFCDDLAILLPDKKQGESVINILVNFLDQHLSLSLNLQKTKLCLFSDGFDFLGFHFCPAGRTPGEKAQKKIRKRLQYAMDKEEKRQILQRWQAYYGNDIDIQESLSSLHLPFIEIFSQLFRGNPKHFSRGHKDGDRSFYRTVRQPLVEKEIILHIVGKQTLGFFPLHHNKVWCSCLDIDINKKIMKTFYHTDPGQFAIYEDRAIHHTRRIEEVLKSLGINSLIEYSGYKGYHIWIFFKNALTAQLVMEFWSEILENVGQIPRGIKREILPRETRNFGRLGTTIKLPLGRHPLSGVRSVFLDENGEPISNPLPLLRNVQKLDEKLLHMIIAKEKVPNIPKTKVEKLIANCSVVKKLCRKAKEEQDLAHFERLILLYTLGQLGDEGEQKLHEIIGHCYNYSYNYTQKQIQRKKPSPIGCRRIHEIMGEEMNHIEHCCHFDIPHGCYASPLLHIYPQGISSMRRRKK